MDLEFRRLAHIMLERDEGFEEYAYDDATAKRVRAPKGNLTIGIGINLDTGLSKEEAFLLLDHRIKEKWTICEKIYGTIFFNSLPDLQKLALINLAYNVRDLSAFKETNELIKNGEFRSAADRLLTLPYAKQVGKRAERVAKMLRNEEFPYDR